MSRGKKDDKKISVDSHHADPASDAMVTKDHFGQGPVIKAEHDWCGYCCSWVPMTDQQRAMTYSACSNCLADGSASLYYDALCYDGRATSSTGDSSGDAHPTAFELDAERTPPILSQCTSGDAHPTADADAHDSQRGVASDQAEGQRKQRKTEHHSHKECEFDSDECQSLSVSTRAPLCACSERQSDSEVGSFCFYCDSPYSTTNVSPGQGCDPSEDDWTTIDDEEGDGPTQSRFYSEEPQQPDNTPGGIACNVCGIRDHTFKDRCFQCGHLFHEDICGKGVKTRRNPSERPLHMRDCLPSWGTNYYCYPCGQAIQPDSFQR